MIFVREQDEPRRFNRKVRIPGRHFLVETPSPTKQQWKAGSYWREILTEMNDAYAGICAYTCHRIVYDTGFATVDHFVVKTIEPELAYEWSNYRFVCGRMNGRKGVHQDILDPFLLATNVFVLDFPSLQVLPSSEYGSRLVGQAETTINRLGLNDELSVKARMVYVRAYCDSHITIEFLQSNAPFICQEIVRQNVEKDIRKIMSL